MSMRFTEIGQQLRAYRLELGLRAEEIAARLGVSRAALYRYEKGEVIKLDTIKRLAELLKISPLSLLGIGVEYYNRPIGYFERIRQVEETADQILQLFGPICYLTTSDAYDNALAEAFDEAAEQATTERTAMRSMAEQVMGILTARKRMYAMRRPGIIAMVSLSSVQRLLETGVAGSIPVSDRVRRICRDVAVTEVENMAALMEAEPMGLQFGLLNGGGADLGVQDPACPRPGEPGNQSVPAGRASLGSHRGRHDHRRRRGDRGASACGGSGLAGGVEGAGRREPPAATGGDGRARLTGGSSPPMTLEDRPGPQITKDWALRHPVFMLGAWRSEVFPLCPHIRMSRSAPSSGCGAAGSRSESCAFAIAASTGPHPR